MTIKTQAPERLELVDRDGDEIKFGIGTGEVVVTSASADGDDCVIVVVEGADFFALKSLIGAVDEDTMTLSKLEEPALPGAIVVDSEGEIWVRRPCEDPETEYAWLCSHSEARWDGVKAVEVLAPGTDRRSTVKPAQAAAAK